MLGPVGPLCVGIPQLPQNPSEIIVIGGKSDKNTAVSVQIVGLYTVQPVVGLIALRVVIAVF